MDAFFPTVGIFQSFPETSSVTHEVKIMGTLARSACRVRMIHTSLPEGLKNWPQRAHKAEASLTNGSSETAFHDLTGSECEEEDVDFEESDSDESWTTESAISSESILSSMCMNGGDEKPFACPVPGCKKRYKVGFHTIVPRLRTCSISRK